MKKEIKESKFFIDFVRVTGVIPAFFWKRPKVCYYKEKPEYMTKGGVLIASNHITFTDPITLYSVFWKRRLRFFVTKDLYKNELLTALLKMVGCIQVDKENFSMNSLRSAVEKLKAGNALLIFPEGQVNSSEDTLSYKSGAVFMSNLSGAPILPVHIAHEKGRIMYHNIAVVGEPIDIKAMSSRFPTMEELQSLSAYVREKELELEEYYVKKIRKEK